FDVIRMILTANRFRVVAFTGENWRAHLSRPMLGSNRRLRMDTHNPLLETWLTPFAIPPFETIESTHFLPAFEAAMREHDDEIDLVVNNPQPPDYANTIDALERAGQTLNKVGGVFWNLVSTDSNEDLRAIEREISPLLARHYTAFSLNAGLFARVATLYESRARLTMRDEQARLLE